MSTPGRVRQLKNELLRRLLLPMASILLISGVLTYQLALRFADRSYDRSLTEDARALARQSRILDDGSLRTLPASSIDMLDPGGGDRVFVQVFSHERGVISGDPELPAPSSEESLVEPTLYSAEVRGESVRVVAVPLASPHGGSLLLLGETRRRRESMASDIVAAVVAPQLALIFLAVVVIVSGVASGLAPLESLAAAIERRRRDDFTPLPVADMPGEVIPLIASFNGLLARLDEAQGVQRRFVADAAHQLRTPLAALKIQLDQAIRSSDAEHRKNLLNDLRVSVERMARLSSQLLLLARAEPGGSNPVCEALDLVSLAREVGSQWVPRALACGRDLGLDVPSDPVVIRGDRVMLGELIGNLIDNALRYGGHKVTVSVHRDMTGHRLDVEDDGPGIPSEERQRVFERFYRVPGTSGEGSGLGLSIVAEIAAAHGADVTIENLPDRGVSVGIRFAREQHRPGETG